MKNLRLVRIGVCSRIASASPCDVRELDWRSFPVAGQVEVGNWDYLSGTQLPRLMVPVDPSVQMAEIDATWQNGTGPDCQRSLALLRMKSGLMINPNHGAPKMDPIKSELRWQKVRSG